MAIEYGSLRNANVDIDRDGRVWLWIKADNQQLGIDLSGALTDPAFDLIRVKTESARLSYVSLRHCFALLQTFCTVKGLFLHSTRLI